MNPIWMLAFDHRNSFRRSFLGIVGEPTPGDHETARRAKRLIMSGVVRAIEDGIPAGQPAVLVDEQYGADVLALAREHGIPTAVPVEASGRSELAFEHDDEDFARALGRVDPTYAKVLVRYNPDDDAASNERQRGRLRQLQRACADQGRSWMLELLVPPTRQQQLVDDGESGYDLDVRPGLTVRATRELVEDGLAPTLWKLEGMATSQQYRDVATACGADGASTGCLVLGRGADRSAVARWLQLAAPVDGFVGFAVGRTIWWDAVRSHLDGDMDEAAAAGAIAANYRGLIDTYRATPAEGDQ